MWIIGDLQFQEFLIRLIPEPVTGETIIHDEPVTFGLSYEMKNLREL